MLQKFLKPRAGLTAVVLVGTLARIVAALILGNTVTDLPAIFDQVSYHHLALRILAGHGFSFATFSWPYTQAGQPTAHWSYLYTLLLVVVYGLVGVYPVVMRLLQAVISGWLMPVLTYRICRQVINQKVALVAAAWTALYAYFIYYDVALMTESFYLMGVLWVLDIALRLAPILNGSPEQSSRSWRLWVEMGVAILITALLRQLFLLFVPFLFIWLAWQAWSAKGSQAPQSWLRKLLPVVRGSAIVCAILFVFIAPITVFNYERFGRIVLLNTNAGFAFFWANHPIYGDHFVAVLDTSQGQPTYQDLIPVELRQLNEAEMDSALMQRGFEFIFQDPARYIRLSLSRIPVYFMFWPSSDSGLISNFARVASFGVALPFMLVGLWLWLRQPRKPASQLQAGLLLLLFAVVYSAIHLLSWALVRYRLPVDSVLLIFASQAALSAFEWLGLKIGFKTHDYVASAP